MTNTLFVLNNASTAKSSWEVRAVFPDKIFRNTAFKIDRDFTYAQTAGVTDRNDIWTDFRRGYFKAPFYYLGLPGGTARHNAIDYMAIMADAPGNTYATLRNNAVFTAKLDFGTGLAGALIPDDYHISSTLYSGRSMSTCQQNSSFRIAVGKDFPIKKLGFWVFQEKAGSGHSVRDLSVRYAFNRKYDYNTKQISDGSDLSVGSGIRWSRDQLINLTYTFKNTYTWQSLFEGDPGYRYMGIGASSYDDGASFGDIERLPDGSLPAYIERPGKTENSHVLNLSFTFPSRHPEEIRVFGIKVPIDPLWRHNNLIQLSLTRSSYDVDRAGKYSFSEIFERPFYIKLQHSIEYDFSAKWSSSFYLMSIFEQWRLVRPTQDGLGLIEEGYGLSFGMEMGLNMQIRF
jgi:hypothetical protein